MAYNLLDLRARVRTKIKDTSYPASTIDGFINDAIAEISGLFPFRNFQKIIDGDLTVGEYTYDQQADHETTIKLILIDPVNSTSYFDLTSGRLTSDKFFNSFPVPDSQGNAQPAYWTEYGDQLYFNCPVDKAYTLRQLYQKLPTELSDDADVPELPSIFREAIVLGATYRCEEERGNYDIAAIVNNHFSDKVGDLMTRFANDTLSGPDTVVMPGVRGEIYG